MRNNVATISQVSHIRLHYTKLSYGLKSFKSHIILIKQLPISGTTTVETSGEHLLLVAVEDLLKDPSFHTGTQVAVGALQAAEILTEWCVQPENQTKLKEFAEKLLEYL